MYANRGKQKGNFFLPNSVCIDDELDIAAVRMFRYKLAERDLLPSSQDNYHTMLRFLKATRSPRIKQYDYDSAIQKWEEVIKWRRTKRADTIIQDFVYKEHEDVRLCYPQGFHGVDKAGRPIYIKFVDRIDSAKMMKTTTVDRFMKSYIQECEKMVVEKFPACSEVANKSIDSVVYIIVLPTGPSNRNKGFKATMYANMLAVRLTKILFYYYPQTVHQYFYINAGIVGKLLVRLNNWICDPRKRPVRFYAFGLGQDFRTKLLEFIDEDQLPTLLGGSCTCPGKEGGCLRFEKGPWEVQRAKGKNLQAKDKNAEMVLNKRKEIPETKQIILSQCPETIQHKNAKLPSDLDIFIEKLKLSPQTVCHKCAELENTVNLLSSKLDKLQTTVNLLSSAQDRQLKIEFQGN